MFLNVAVLVGKNWKFLLKNAKKKIKFLEVVEHTLMSLSLLNFNIEVTAGA